MEVGRFMGYLHPALIHFPIVLLLIAVALDGVDFFLPNSRLEWTTRLLLVLGVVSSLFAFVCGNFAEIWAARSGISQDALEYHEFLATVSSWLFVALTAWKLLMPAGPRRIWRAVWLAVAASACGLLILTGHRGAELVYSHGAAVQNIAMLRPPSHDDLVTLSQRQDPASILYSEMMHHVFGWLVLLLSAMLAIEHIAPKAAAKLRRFGPLLLLAGGIFLLIFSDQDAWPLYHVRPFRPITDKEVLLHKTYAVLMLLVGSWGVGQGRMGRRRAESAAVGSVAREMRIDSRTMAVFALVGGALLFTHVHSAAPYANVAVGVYVHHTALGLVALAIGAVRVLDDVFAPARWRSLAFPALMALESLFLINYNEGLPWFLGYGSYTQTPAHGGLVTPFGDRRAELVYHPETQRLEVFVMRKDSPIPAALNAQELAAIVRVGQEETEVPLRANPGGERVSAHFAATVPFLKGQQTFQLLLRPPAGYLRTADFEPWIDPASLPRPRARAPFVCPMHPEIGGPRPGACRICGMALVPAGSSRPRGALHDPDLKMEVSTEPARIEPRYPVRLTFRLTDGQGQTVRDLAVVHTKKLHLIVASDDLSYFDHVHPEQQADGSLRIEYTFPHGGRYLLFCDTTPAARMNQVFHVPISVEGAAPPRALIEETAAAAKLLGEYRVELKVSPPNPRPGDECALTFELSRAGAPVTDLQPLLGAFGHCVIISQETTDYLHSHPVGDARAGASGPAVSFHTTFPHSGLYKLWAQFRRGGRPITADFVLRVN